MEPAVTTTLNDPQKFNIGLFRDDHLEYLQPPKRKPIRYQKAYVKPTLKMDSNTTYHLSYMNLDNAPPPRFQYKEYPLPLTKMGRIEFDTITKLSYLPVKGKVRRAFYPRSCLTIGGCHDMITTQNLSYSDPGVVKTRTYKPFQGPQVKIPMEFETVTQESYRPFDRVIPMRKYYKPQFWQTKEKTEYHTTTKLSYPAMAPQPKRIMYKSYYHPSTAGQTEKHTTYSLSYQVPGSFRVKAKQTS